MIFLDTGFIYALADVADDSHHRVRGENGETERVLKAGEVLMIPSNLPHGAEALEDSLSLDVFGPPRQDWIDGTDAYLREQDAQK